jgi:hypothetical protein
MTPPRAAASTLRKNFVAGLLSGLGVVWPILSALLGLIVALGLVVGLIVVGARVHLLCIRIRIDDRLR